MKHYRTETVERKVVEKVTCDRCKQEIPRTYGYEVRDFELSFEEGAHYPECRSTKGWKVPDLCDDCVGYLESLLDMNGFTRFRLDGGELQSETE